MAQLFSHDGKVDGSTPETSIYGDNLLPIIAIAQNGFHLSITDIAFVRYVVITDKLWRQTILYAHSVQS